MPDDTVRRDLHLTDPFTAGPDVTALQHALNEIASQFPRIVTFKLAEDGKLGPQTLQATHKAAHVMGLIRRTLTAIEKQHLIPMQVQRKLRNPGSRSEAEKQRAKRRRDNLRKRLQSRPGLKTMRVTMSPGNPHWGGGGDVLAAFIEPFMVKRGLPIGSGKRTPAHNKAVGGSPTSDHLTTKTRTAARDFPTFAGEDDARALAKALGINSWKPNAFTTFPFSAGGHTFHTQILWGAQIQHADHVHVGISPA